MLWALVVAAASGVSMTFQGVFNTVVSRAWGVPGMAVLVNGSGLVVATAVAMLSRSNLDPGRLKAVPPIVLLGGALGVAIVGGVAYAVARVGAALSVSVIVTAQLAAAVLLDHLGAFGLQHIPVSWVRLLGALLAVGGCWLMAHR